MGYGTTYTNNNPMFVCPRTGRSYATEAIAFSIEGSCTEAPQAAQVQVPIKYLNSDGSIGYDERLRDTNGQLMTNQTTCSQDWMNAGYKGSEPTMEYKAAQSNVLVAYDNALMIAATAKANALATGTPVSSRISTLAAIAYKEAGVTMSTPASSPGAETEWNVISPLLRQSTETPGTDVGQADIKAGTLGLITKYGLYIIGAIVIIFLLMGLASGRLLSGVRTS